MILFIYINFSTFVKKDYEILKKHFSVKSFRYKASKKVSVNLSSQFEMFIWLLRNIGQAQFVYIWFADYHSFLPILLAKMLGKKSILVLGGYDVTYIPELKYGSFSNPLRAFCARFSMEGASICLPVSYYVEKKAKKRVKRLNSKVIYNGIDIISNEWEDKKENIVLTVGICNSLRRIKLKGIDFFVEIAKVLPDYKFIAIGISKKAEEYLGQVPENVQLIGALSHEKLIDFYKKAKVYCQFSLVESFGLSVAEAMLYGCIPIVTNVGALPEIVNDVGLVLNERNLEEATALVKIAMKNNLGKKARERIMENFLLERREKKLLLTIGKV